jgi:NADPH:quinone reductase
MKTAWYENHGSADQVLQIGEMPIPQPKPNEVLVRVYASGINPSDVKRRHGSRDKIASRIIPHSDGAGIVEKIGDHVSPDRLGQRVWIYNAQWQRSFGTAAEFVVLPSELAVPLSDHISFEVGACLGIPAMTAHHAVFSDGPVQGKTILVVGGAGNVGRYAIQFAKWGGATVITTISNDEKKLHAKQAGADYLLNYHEENIIDRVNHITNGAGIDRVIEVDFGGNLSVNQAILKLNGCIAAYASTSNPNPSFPFYALMFKGITIHLVNVYDLPGKARQQAIDDIQTLLKLDKLTHVIAAHFTLDDIIAAHQFVENDKSIGNVLITI